METRKDENLDLVDRISDLPGSILGIILSFLPTKNAVSTAILSKRWKFVWMNVHNLDFRYEDYRSRIKDLSEEDTKFIRFVNHVLLLLDGGLLNKFSLVWSLRFIPSQVSTWINTAITRNVHHLVVSVHSNFEALEVPISLFRCDSLQSLELNGCIYVSEAVDVCLPRLETLKLVLVYFHSEEAFEKLISGCPMLNYLQLDVDMDRMVKYSKDNAKFDYEYIDEFKYIIISTSLRRLELLVQYPEDWYTSSLKLEASSLEYLKLYGYITEVSVQGTLSSLVEADFRFQCLESESSEDTCNLVVEAVRAFHCAKVLTLSMEAMWAISNATSRLSTKFTRLTKLEAASISSYCSLWRDFIQSSDNLEVLTLEHWDDGWQDFDDAHYDSKWIAPVEVPRCLSNSLKEFSFKGYSGFLRECEMIAFMLKHGSALEVVQVTCRAPLQRNQNYVELVKIAH